MDEITGELISVRTATVAERPAVIRSMVEWSSVPDVATACEAIFTAEKRGELTLDRLLVATSDGRICGVQLLVVPGDGSALVWVPAVRLAAAAPALMTEAVDRCDDAGVRFAQCLRPEDDNGSGPLLRQAGFDRVTELLSFATSIDGDSRPPGPAVLKSEPFEANDFADWADLLERTYEGSADCPEAGGLRSGKQSLQGHLAAAGGDTSGWRRYRVDGRDAGLVLTAPHTGVSAQELTYLGLTPQFRGQGLGRLLLADAVSEAAEGFRSVFVTCDARNAAAVSLYRSGGFVEEARQTLWLRVRR